MKWLIGVAVTVAVSAAAPYSYLANAWRLHYMPHVWVATLYGAAFLIVGVGLLVAGATLWRMWRDWPRPVVLVLAAVCITGGVVNLAGLNLYGNWKRMVRWRFETQLDVTRTRQLIAAEAARVRAASDEPSATHSYDLWPPPDEHAASLLRPVFEALPMKSASLRTAPDGQPYLYMDDSGGFLMPWGIAIGSPSLQPSALRFTNVEVWSPGVLFFDANR